MHRAILDVTPSPNRRDPTEASPNRSPGQQQPGGGVVLGLASFSLPPDNNDNVEGHHNLRPFFILFFKKKFKSSSRMKGRESADLGGQRHHSQGGSLQLCVCNDPSAGSPTETLLRLLLPLNDKV
jgi:hypothetical protein